MTIATSRRQEATLSRTSTTPRPLAAKLRQLHPLLHRTDVLLGLLFASTVVVITIPIAGRPVAISDLMLIPVLFLLITSPERVRFPPVYFLVALTYLLWCTLSLGWSDDLTQTFGTLVQYIEFFFLIPLAFMYVRTLRGVVSILNFYVVAVTVLAVFAVGFAIANRTFSYLYFLDYQKNGLGAFTANGLVLAVGLMILSPGARNRYWFAIITNAAALFFSSSRGSMLGVIVGLAVFLLLVRRIRYGIILSVVIVVFVFVYVQFIDPDASTSLTDFSADSSAGSRWMIWDDAARVISESPYIGHSVGSYFISIPSIGFSQRDPSNVFLLNLAEIGAVGLALFIVLLGATVLVAVRNASIFRKNPAYAVLSATLMAAFVSHIAHIQIDVAWVRGTGAFAFACVGLMMKLRQLHARDIGAGTLPV